MRARTAQWMAGCTAAGSIALIGGGVALAYLNRHLVPASLTGWTVSNISAQVVNVAVPVAGFVLASRRPENRIGWLFLVAGLTLGLSGFWTSTRSALHRGPGVLASGPGVRLAAQCNLDGPDRHARLFAPALPTGHLHSRRWRLAAWFVGGAFALITVWLLIVATQWWAHPFTPPSQATGLTALLSHMTGLLISAALLVSGAALVVRFAKSSGEERLQLKWCATAALLLVVVFVASIWLNSAAVNVLQSLAFLCLFTAIAIAVLKYRLYDIDRIISRTLAYAIVTGLLVGVYAGLVLLATEVLQLKSPVAVAGSTLVAAALFSPLRSRVQRTVDQRFNRARYDADQMARVRRPAEGRRGPGRRASRPGRVVQRALEPAHVSVWMKRRG